ncbi:MAG: hypothetical protein JRN39_04110 [Nitrososphaerota archaeon]|nr:hypothetical protein [Nitrososphaerota archaeon]MDG6939569.1 hypothetical protein [Nitrososphaerota archaeon]
MIDVPLGEWFRLPRLGTEGFRRLMGAGLEYETATGFRVKEGADLVLLKGALESEVRDKVEFSFGCQCCGARTSCADCRYHGSCSIERSGRCVCGSCAALDLREHARAWRSLLAASGD